MKKKGKLFSDVVDSSSKCNTKILYTTHPNAEVFRRKGILRMAMSNLREKCEVYRYDQPVHILIFTMKGRGKLFAQGTGKDKIITSKHLTILPAHQPHHYKLHGNNWQGLWFFLEDNQNWDFLRSKKHTNRISNAANELESAMQGYLNESFRKDFYSKRALGYYAELITLILERELSLNESLQSCQMRQSVQRLWEKVSLAPQYCWTVDELAAKMYISPQYLYKIAKHYSGRTPMEMVYRIRMQLAQELLISTEHTISVISLRVGYHDPFAFSTAFKKFSGCSPRTYRRDYGKL